MAERILADDRALAELFGVLARRGIVVPANAAQQMLAYLALLRRWNQRTQLVSRNDEAGLIKTHVAESFAPACIFDFSTISKLLDFGSGGGFPGVPLAILFPKLHVDLLESKRKKALFLQKVCIDLQLENVDVLPFHSDDSAAAAFCDYEVVIARAVARLHKLWQSSARLLKTDGMLLAMKGGELDEEIHELLKEKPNLNVEIRDYPNELVPADKKRKLVVVNESTDI